MNTRPNSSQIARLSLSTVLAYAAFHGLGYGQMFVGETIGVNFQGTAPPPGSGVTGVLSTDLTTGVLLQADWNNINFEPTVPVGSGTTDLPVLTSNLWYDNVTPTTHGTSNVSLLVQATSSAKSGVLAGSNTNNRILMNGIIKDTSTTADPTFSFGGLAGGYYKTIVYTAMNGNGGTYSATLGGKTYYQTAVNGVGFTGSFVRGTNTVAGTTPTASYVQFDLTSAVAGTMDLGFHWLGGGTGAGVAGIQMQLVQLIDVWSGSVNGNWDVNTTANWNGNGAAKKFLNADFVAFGDVDGNLTSVSNRTITVAAGGVTVGSFAGSTIAVDNSLGDYTFGGGSINGASSLTKSGTSELNLNATNGYTGGTVIKGGIVRLGGVNALGSGGSLSLATGTTLDLNSRSQTVGALTGNGLITTTTSTATSTLTVASGTVTSGFGDPTINGQISDGAGTVALAKNTVGTLSIKGANAFSGGTTISGGTLSIGHNAALGTGPVTLAGGATLSLDQGVGLSEGLLGGSFNTTGANPNTNVTSTARLAGVTAAQQPFPAGLPDNSTAIYTGYIFNPSASAAPWTFAESFDDSVLLKINGATVLNDTVWNNPTRNSVLMAPGYNAFELRLGQGGGGVGPVGGTEAGLFGLAVNTTGADPALASSYTALPVDNGSGNAFVGGFAGAISNAIALTGSATVNVGNGLLGTPTNISLATVAIGSGSTLTLTAAAANTTITATSTTFSGTAGLNVASGITYSAGPLDGGAGVATLTKTGSGTLRASAPAISLVAGSVVNVAAGTLALGGDVTVEVVGNAPMIGSASLTLAGGTTLSLDGYGGIGPGLLGRYYSVQPPNPHTAFNDYSTFTSYFAGLTPTLTASTSIGGKLDFNFSNANDDGSGAYGDGAPFNGNGTNPTRGAYGFTNVDNMQVMWTGMINITNAGLAHFQTVSDDGTMVFIDGVTVVNNNFFQGAQPPVGGDVNLTVGLHQITLGFYEGGGGAGALFQWNQSGDALHTLLNSEVSGGGSFVSTQTYANNISVTGNNATIAVNNSRNAVVGILSLGVGVTGLNITSTDATGAARSVSAASTSISGSTTFNVTNGPSGSVNFVPGSMVGNATTTITKTGNGTLTLTGTQSYKTLIANGGTTNIDTALGTGNSILNANATTNISVSQTLSALNIGTVPFVDGDLSAQFADAAVVPEPSALGLLMFGSLGILGRRWRWKSV